MAERMFRKSNSKSYISLSSSNRQTVMGKTNNNNINNNNQASIDEQLDEQCRNQQNDEFKALKECFADQLEDLRKNAKVSKNPKKRKRERLWVPLDLIVKINSHPEPIASFDLHIKCSRKYPQVPPAIGFKNVKGVGRHLIAKLHKELKYEAASGEYKGQGCIAWLIKRAQQFLEDHYHDLELNNKSLYDQMVESKQNCDRKAKLDKKRQDEMDKLERDRQVEEIRQKILRKRELYNESKKRRDSQNSTLENEPDDSTYDYEGDLDASSTTTSLTDDNDLTTNRLNDLDEIGEDEKTLVRSRRSTFVGSRELLKSNDDGDTQGGGGGLMQSRVNLEYEVIEELGHGGFGTVYKVRNRVDSRLYALKKVKLNPDNETLNEKIMREVKLLSRLNHENVIRYYTTWIETEAKEHSNSKIISSSGHNDNDSDVDDEDEDDNSTLSAKKINSANDRQLSESSDDEIDDVYHTSYLISDKNVEKMVDNSGETTANYVVFDTSGDNKDETEIVESMKKALGPKSISNNNDNLDEDDDDFSENNSEYKTLTNSKDNNSASSNNGKLTKIKISRWLYIQMELGQGTLREAIDQGLPKQKDRARRFFREILDGLCHIHRQGIIHRDLKPVNIFLDSMDRPKIGDFGLATTNLFIVTQSSTNTTSGGGGVSTIGGAKAIKPNRMSLESLRLLASPDNQNSSPGERLKYIQYNQTDNIGTPLYMSPELSATNEKTRISKVIYSHKVDVYSLGIIYFEMLYSFKTGHERIIIIQNLREKSILMPDDVEQHLLKQDVDLIKLLLTHDVSTRPTSEKLLTSNLLPSIGIKEREYQNIIKQVVQNRQARTHKHMIRLLFEQNDSYVDDFVFDYGDFDKSNNYLSNSSKSSSSSSNIAIQNSKLIFDSQNLLKDFNTNTFVLDQVKMKLENLLRSKGFINFVTPLLMPKYSASKYYNRQQLEDVVMLMDKNSSILTLPYDLKLSFARTIARTNINYMNRFAIEKIYRQRQVLGYHPDQLWECCVDIVTPPAPQLTAANLNYNNYFHISDAEILNLIGEVVLTFPCLLQLKPIIKINNIKLIKSIFLLLGISETLFDDLIECITDSMSVSLKQTSSSTSSQYANNSTAQSSSALNLNYQSTTTTTTTTGQMQNLSGGGSSSSSSSLAQHVKDELKKDLLASRILSNIKIINSLINLLDIAGSTPYEVYKQIENFYYSKNLKTIEYLENIKKILKGLDETINYAQSLGLDFTIRISAGFVIGALRPISFYSGMICQLQCNRHNKRQVKKSQSPRPVILAIGGRYDKLIEKFSKNRSEVFDRVHGSGGGGGGGGGFDGRNNCDSKTKVAIGISFGVEKLSRFMLEHYVEELNNSDHSTTPSLQQLINLNTNQLSTLTLGSSTTTTNFSSTLNQTNSSSSSSFSTINNSSQYYNIPAFSIRYWPLDIAICSLTHPKSKSYISIIGNLIKQLRDKGLMCNEILPNEFPSFTLNSLMLHCLENKVPYMMTIKAQSSNVSGAIASEDDFLQESSSPSSLSITSPIKPISPNTSPTSPSPSRSSGSSFAFSNNLNCIATLYQLDKSRLKEIKRCDTSSMIEFLIKR